MVRLLPNMGTWEQGNMGRWGNGQVGMSPVERSGRGRGAGVDSSGNLHRVDGASHSSVNGAKDRIGDGRRSVYRARAADISCVCDGTRGCRRGGSAVRGGDRVARVW
jgi:hypothetical protein